MVHCNYVYLSLLQRMSENQRKPTTITNPGNPANPAYPGNSANPGSSANTTLELDSKEWNKQLAVTSKNTGGAGAPADPKDDYVTIRVCPADDTSEVMFRVKKLCRLDRLKRAYCAKLGIDELELRFVFEGHRITDEDTPKELGIENNGVIEVYQQRMGGFM